MSFQNARIRKVGASPIEYRATEARRGDRAFPIGSSSLRAFWSCPAKWVKPIELPDGEITYWELPGTKATEWGNLFDCMLLTPEQFGERYALKPAVYPCEPTKKDPRMEKPWNANSTWCSEWIEQCEASGRIPVSGSDMFKVQQAIGAFTSDPILGPYVEESERQVWIEGEWRDEATKLVVPVKCLIDLCPREDSEFHKSIGDVKTTKNARVLSWEKWCHAIGYEIQAAWNTDLFVAATGREILSFCFLLSESEAPYQPGRRMMSQDIIDPRSDQGDIASGRRQYRQMMADYCKCLASGFWPGFDDTDESIAGWSLVRPNPYAEQARAFAPKYALPDEESEEIEEEADVIP